MKKIIALVPVKAFSKRVPNKNLQCVGSFSLFERKILQLKKSIYISEIFVGSDSDEILKIAENLGAIPILRDRDACDESISTANIMIEDFANRVDGDLAVWAHCTNPFLYAKHYDAAIETFLSLAKPFDSVVSVTKIQSHLWSHHGHPLNFNPYADKHPFASQLDPIFYQNGGIFIQNLNSFRSNSYFYGNRPKMVILDEMESFDINTFDELSIAKELVNYFDKKFNFSQF